MRDRLAEIEATRKKILSEYEFSRADDDMLMLLTSGIPWLLARVRELEAQAARDAEVRGAVYKLGVGTGASRDRGRFESCWRHRGATQNLREEVSGASAD